MPVFGTSKARDVSPSSRPMALAAPNSPARRAQGLLEPYHDIASTFFSVGKGPDLDDILLTASRDGDFERILELLRRRNEAIINIDARDRVTGNTPLIWAAKRGHGKIVQQLLSHGADVTLRNYEGQTAVEVASPAIRNQLLESVDRGGPHRNLLQAAWQGNAKLLKKILAEARVDINCRNADGLTPLLLVTRDVQLFERLKNRGRGFEPQQVVSELLTSRADPNAVDEEGRTPLHYVSSSKAYQGSDIIKMLLRDGSDVHTRDRRCFTPIHCASQTGNVDVVIALLDGGSDANARGYAGSTPLHISAINGHDHVVNKLLQRGADVTIVDDSGLTPVDVAKTKKVKQTLKQAWTEATQGKIKENLGPVRPPSSTSRRSFDGTTAAPPPPKSPKKGGQVIFDTLPTTSSTSLDALTPRRAAVTLLQRQLNDAEKVRKAEDQRMRNVISASSVRSRSRTPSANTPHGISGQRLSPLRNASPANKPATIQREIKFSPGTKDYDGGRGVSHRRMSTGETPTTPTLQRECSIPVTMLGFDLDDQYQNARSKRSGGPAMSKRGTMYRSFSSESSIDPSDESLLKGSSSRTSLSTNADWDELSTSPPRQSSVRTPSASSLNRLTTIEERSIASGYSRPLILDLDQMVNIDGSPILGDSALNQHPNSKHLLPPTPVYMQNGDPTYELRDMECDDLSYSSKENSPRTEEELQQNALQVPVDPNTYHEGIRLAVTNAQELTRQKSVIQQGNFSIEQTRVQQSDDSGCPEEISSSTRSSINSTDGTVLPPDALPAESQKPVPRPSTQSSNSSVKGVTVTNPREKLKLAARENAAKRQSSMEETVQKPGNASATKPAGVIVHSDALSATVVSARGPQQDKKSTVPSSTIKQPKSHQPHVSAPTSAPAAAPLDEPLSSSLSSQTSKGLLKIKLTPKVSSASTTEQRTVPERPPPPGSASKDSKQSLVLESNKLVSVKQAPPRPVAPPRSRTPSASSVSSSGSSGKEAPSRPPPPKQKTIPVTNKATVVKKHAVNSSAKKSANNAPASSNLKREETQTTSFRLSSYLKENQQPVTSYNLAKDQVESNKPDVSPTDSSQSQQTKSGPAIILTSQSQTRIDLSTIPDVLTTQPPIEDKEVEPVKSQVKTIAVQEAAPSAEPPATPGTPGVNKSLAMSISDVKLNEKPTQDEHSGPIIWDPFETIRAKQKAADPEKQPDRPKTARKSATKRKAPERTTSAQRSTTVKSKEGKLSDINKKSNRPRSPRGRPKSPRSRSRSPRSSNNNKKTKKKKGKKSSNKVEVLIPDHPELNPGMDNVAYIGGVGWQLRTECNEDEPIHQVRFGRPPMDYDTDDDEATPRLTVVPNYLNKNSPDDLILEDPNYNSYLQLPGQYDFTDSGESTEDDLDYLLPDAEETVTEVVFDLTPRIVNGVEEVPKKKMLSPRTVLKRGGTVDEDLEEIIPDEKTVINHSRRPSVDNNSNSRGPSIDHKSNSRRPSTDNNREKSDNEEIKDDQKENKKEVPSDQNEAEPSDDDQPSLKFDKKGVMGWKKRSARSIEVMSAKPKKPQTARPTTSAKPLSQSNTPKQSPKQTPAATPKQTPSATPKQTPSTTPKQTPSTTPKATPSATPKQTPTVTPKPTPGSTPKTTPTASPMKTKPANEKTTPPQPPPRKSKLNKSATEAPASKPVPPKRNNKAQQGTDSKAVSEGTKQPVKETPKSKQQEKKNLQEKEQQEKVAQQKEAEGSQEATEQPAKEPADTKDELQRHEKQRHELKKMLSNDEDTEIDAMIDEILKTTPHPSMSLSLKSKKAAAEVAPERTKEEIIQMSIDARNRLESELSKSQNGKLFCQIPVQQAIHKEEDIPEQLGEPEEPEVPLSAKEQKELEKLMDSIKKMELTIGSNQSDENHNMKESSQQLLLTGKTDSAKPPLPPKAAQQSGNTDSGSSFGSTEKSPRFVRKLDSWKDGLSKQTVVPPPVRNEDDSDDDSLVDDDFHSDALSVASAFSERDEDIIPKDSRVVTSRIGRRSAAGRAASAMSSHESCAEDNVETIQWKRGNMLGKGAYGKVWCGLTNLGELIAVKQIELNINDMEQAELEYEKIQEEVELLKTLKHPNIVGYLGTSLEDNIVSIFMQFIPGGSIANLLARFGALDEEVFCHYTKQILEGVAYLHQNNVIHRDIKGGNVMLMHNGIIKLIDFGCAKRLCLNINSMSNSNKALLKSMRGTPYWMAPEVVRETGYGTKSDIWSIGCTVYEMATRKPPWADVPPMAALFAIGMEKETPQLPEKFSTHARDFVNQCMTRDQCLRPSATELLTHAFMVRRKKKK